MAFADGSAPLGSPGCTYLVVQRGVCSEAYVACSLRPPSCCRPHSSPLRSSPILIDTVLRGLYAGLDWAPLTFVIVWFVVVHCFLCCTCDLDVLYCPPLGSPGLVSLHLPLWQSFPSWLLVLWRWFPHCSVCHSATPVVGSTGWGGIHQSRCPLVARVASCPCTGRKWPH